MANETQYDHWAAIEMLRLRQEQEARKKPAPPATADDAEAQVRQQMEEALKRRFEKKPK